MAALYLLPNKLGRPPLPQLLAKGEEGLFQVEGGEQGREGAGQGCGQQRLAWDCPPPRAPVGSGTVASSGAGEMASLPPSLSVGPLGGPHGERC